MEDANGSPTMQTIFNGLISGSAVALLAVAFQMVYLPTRIFFIGIAGLYSLAPYCVAWARQAGLPLWLSISAAAAVATGLAILFETVNHAPLFRRRASEGAHLISSLGLYIILVQGIAIVSGNESKTLRSGVDHVWQIGTTVFSQTQLVMAGVSCLVLTAGWVVLQVTDVGLRLRALADNPVQFALFGFDLNAHRLIAFSIAGVLAAASSLLTAYDIGYDPYTGLHAVLIAIVAVMVGGRHTFAGPAVGALLIGVVRTQVVWHFSSRWQDAFTFAVLAAFLLLRPHGLLGRATRLEAAA